MDHSEKERQWKQFINLARSIAGKIAHKYCRPYSDMLDVAEYALALTLWDEALWAEDEWDPKRAGLSTFIYSRVYFHLLNVVTRGIHPSPRGKLKVRLRERWLRESPVKDINSVVGRRMGEGSSKNWLAQLLAELSEEGCALVGIILEAPEEVMNGIQSYLIDELDWSSERIESTEKNGELFALTPGVARNAVKDYLIDELDWTRADVSRVWREVKECL